MHAFASVLALKNVRVVVVFLLAIVRARVGVCPMHHHRSRKTKKERSGKHPKTKVNVIQSRRHVRIGRSTTGEHHAGPIHDGRVSPPLRDHLPVHATPLARSPGRREQPTTVTGRSAIGESRFRRRRLSDASRSEKTANASGKHTKRYGREIENPRASVPTNARVSD